MRSIDRRELEALLGMRVHLETRVKVDLGQKKGKITVEFASVDDLRRILGTLAPGFSLTDVVSGKTVSRDDTKGSAGLLVMFLCVHV